MRLDVLGFTCRIQIVLLWNYHNQIASTAAFAGLEFFYPFEI